MLTEETDKKKKKRSAHFHKFIPVSFHNVTLLMQRVEVNQKNLHKGFRRKTFGGQLYQDHEDSIA